MRNVSLLAALGAAALALAPLPVAGQTPAPAAARPAGTFGSDIPVDRIVGVVGEKPIMWSQVIEAVYERRAQGAQVPTDSVGQYQFARTVLGDLIDEEVLVQKATDAKVEVTDEEVNSTVDGQLKQIRSRFPSEAEFRAELRKAGRGTPEELRKSLLEQGRRDRLTRGYIQKMREENKLVPGVVSEEEIRKEFEARKGSAGSRPATVSFRQIVVPPLPSKASRDRALAKAESLLVEIRKGGDFSLIAKRESADPGSKELGGDLGWHRRGEMVPEFDRMMWALPPGQVSPIVETAYGFHIIKVDRVQPAEVKARHILIRPTIDSADVTRAKLRADSAYADWKAGTKFETLVAKYHDRRAQEQTVVPDVAQDSLPESYSKAVSGHHDGDIVPAFAIEDRANNTTKYVVAQITQLIPAGEFTIDDVRARLRDALAQEKGMKRLMASLRQSMYVSTRL